MRIRLRLGVGIRIRVRVRLHLPRQARPPPRRLARPRLDLFIAQPALSVDLVAAQVKEVVREDGRELGQERGHHLVHLLTQRV